VRIVKTSGEVAGAPIAMHLRGERTDALVLKVVQEKHGSAVHEIAQRLNWTNGRVDGSVNRLVSQGKVKVKHSLQRGVLVKRVYPQEYVSKPHNLIEIPLNMIEEDLWTKTVQVYALSRSTIALSPRRVDEWDKRAFQRKQIHIRKGAEELTIELPRSISEFYQLENSETSLSTTGDLALVTVESTALTVALPPTYPAEVSVRVTRFLVFEERIEGVPPCYPLSKVHIDLLRGEGKAEGIPIVSEIHRAGVARKIEEKVSISTDRSDSIQVPVKVR